MSQSNKLSSLEKQSLTTFLKKHGLEDKQVVESLIRRIQILIYHKIITVGSVKKDVSKFYPSTEGWQSKDDLADAVEKYLKDKEQYLRKRKTPKVRTTASRKRCPNGTRKNKKSGECVSTKK